MGNVLRASRRKTTKIMKIDGETTKHKTPIQAIEITTNHPNHVLLDSESVKRHGARAKPLEPAQYLEPKKIYFLIERPNMVDPTRFPRRVRSGGIHMGAKERLESLMLSRRSVSDLSALKPRGDEDKVRVRMRLPRADVERLMSSSKDGDEAARKIMELCDVGSDRVARVPLTPNHVAREKSPLGDGFKKKRVDFLPVTEKEIHFATS